MKVTLVGNDHEDDAGIHTPKVPMTCAKKSKTRKKRPICIIFARHNDNWKSIQGYIKGR